MLPVGRAPRAPYAQPRARSPSRGPAHPPAPCLRAARRACAPCAQPRLKLNWAVAHPDSAIFFFLFFFFISFSHWKIPKNIFIYFLSFSSTPINLLKFISSDFLQLRKLLSSILLFFFHSPTKQINCLNLFYLFSYSSTHCKLQGLFSNMPMCYLPKHINIHITHTYNHSSIHMITHKTHMSCPSFVSCLS